jgi:hypothetical protein
MNLFQFISMAFILALSIKLNECSDPEYGDIYKDCGKYFRNVFFFYLKLKCELLLLLFKFELF